MEKRVRGVVLALAFTVLGTGTNAQRSDDHLGVINGLERAIALARQLGCQEEAELLLRAARGLSRELERRAEEESGRRRGGDDAERREARRQLAVMRHAKGVFAETGRREALELIERAMHARELVLEGRRDREAMQVRQRAPSRGQQAELLAHAAELLADLGAREKAEAVGELARAMAGARERRDREVARSEREVAEHQLEVMRLALGALREGGRRDAAEQLHRAIRALEVGLEGRRDEEAAGIRRRSPDRQQKAELMFLAADLLREFRRPDRADLVAGLGREFARRRGERAGVADGRAEHLQRQIDELREMVHRLRAELRRRRARL